MAAHPWAAWKSYARQLNFTVSQLSARLLTFHRINGCSSSKATHGKHLVTSHSSHNGDLLKHQESQKGSAVLCIYLYKQVKSFQSTKVLLTST